MSLFLSQFVNSIGHQGRISVPSQFRNQLKTDNATQTVILYRSFTCPCIEGCDVDRMSQLSDASDNLDTFSQNQSAINSLVFADARALSVDSAGRITIPAELLEYAGISKDAAFIGCGKTFQIWEPNAFKEYQENLRKEALSIRPTLKLN
jgi:MraZ protein